LAAEDPEVALEDSSLYQFHFGIKFVDIFLNQYLLLLGEFDLDNFDAENKAFTWFVFFLATFLSQVLIFNMLIAIMGDTYAKVSEMKNQAALKEKISILCDYLRIVDEYENTENYILVLKPNRRRKMVGTVSSTLSREVLTRPSRRLRTLSTRSSPSCHLTSTDSELRTLTWVTNLVMSRTSSKSRRSLSTMTSPTSDTCCRSPRTRASLSLRKS